MTETYGYGLELWEEAREEARQILIGCAREERQITYSDLVGEMHAITLDPHDPVLGYMLGQISHQEHAAGRGMLSVLVVHKTGDRMPGPGFFKLARQLDEQFVDEVAFWVTQLKKVIDCWREEIRDGSDPEAPHSS